MELFKIDYQGQPLRLEGSMAGWQQLFWNNQLVSSKSASASGNDCYVHEFDIELAPEPQAPMASTVQPQVQPQVQHCRIEAEINWQPFEVTYHLFVDDQLVTDGKRNYKDIEKQVPFEIPKAKKNYNLLGLTTLAVKLVKSTKLIKLTLAGASLAVYSWLFSFTFAAALLISLLFHELGRAYALRYFGIATKGLYLIPFVAGLAVREEQVNTRWQAVVVALAGPCCGLLMSLFYWFVYGLSGNLFFAGLASLNALINLFNLLPILPMAGGQVLKHISFSMNSKPAALLWTGVLGLGVVVSFQMGLLLFSVLLLVAGSEMMVAWRHRHMSHLLPLDRYGQLFTLCCYGILWIGFFEVIWFFAGMGDDVLGLPLRLLQL